MSKGFIFDPLNRVKRTPYAECKPEGIPATILGTPDNKLLDKKLMACATGGVMAGFPYGLYATVLKPTKLAPRIGETLAMSLARGVQGAATGGLLGTLYFIVVTGSSKIRGNKDDSVNHFLGGYALSAIRLFSKDLPGFFIGGTLAGALLASFKSFYMNDVQFFRTSKGSHVVTQCRYPEIYLYNAKAPEENLK